MYRYHSLLWCTYRYSSIWVVGEESITVWKKYSVTHTQCFNSHTTEGGGDKNLRALVSHHTHGEWARGFGFCPSWRARKNPRVGVKWDLLVGADQTRAGLHSFLPSPASLPPLWSKQGWRGLGFWAYWAPSLVPRNFSATMRSL